MHVTSFRVYAEYRISLLLAALRSHNERRDYKKPTIGMNFGTLFFKSTYYLKIFQQSNISSLIISETEKSFCWTNTFKRGIISSKTGTLPRGLHVFQLHLHFTVQNTPRSL
jgi:hypothetical protein